MVDFLQQNGVNAQFNGKNDIMVDDFKVSGNAELKTKTKTLVHGTLLYDVDLSKIQKYLLPNPIKLESKKIKSNVAKVKNIIEFLPNHQPTAYFLNEMIGFFKKVSGIKRMSNDVLDVHSIHQLQETKYRNWDWTFGKAASFKDQKEKYFPGKGYVKIQMNVREGVIVGVKFSGDFLGYLGTAELEQTLTNQMYKKDVLADLLAHVNIKEIFGEQFIRDDLLELMF